MICELFCFCVLVDDGVGCAGGTAFDIDLTWSMALDSQSDKVGFDEVYDQRTTRSQSKNPSSSL